MKTVCFVYDLEFGVQQLIPNFQGITNKSQTPYDFPKQTPLNPTTIGIKIHGIYYKLQSFIDSTSKCLLMHPIIFGNHIDIDFSHLIT